MSIYLVTFKLGDPNVDPSNLVGAIKKLGNGWMYYIPTVVFINSSESADSISKKLLPLITNDDYLFVTKITKEQQGWMPKDAWKWLNESIY